MIPCLGGFFDNNRGDTGDSLICVHGTQDPIISTECAHTLGRNNGQENAIALPAIDNCLNPDQPQVWRVFDVKGVAPSLQSGEGRGNAILTKGGSVHTRSAAVRRLTPRECERLMGFEDDYTLIPDGKKMAADGPRYKALGNSWAVPNVAWIGRRIEIVDKIIK